MFGSEYENLTEVLKIRCFCYEDNIYPWQQDNLRTPVWRFYWNPTPGGFLKVHEHEIALEPENFYIIPGSLIFSTFAQKPFSQFYIHFSIDERQRPQNEIFKLPADENTLFLIKRLIAKKICWENRQLAHLSAISIVTSTLMRLPEEIFSLPPEYDPRIEKVIKYIKKNSNRIIPNDDLAQYVGMSRNGFLHLFEQEVGEAPQTYCRRNRIEQACNLLYYSNMTIDEIAEYTGFADRYHFSRVFWKIMHFTPAKYRKHIQRDR